MIRFLATAAALTAVYALALSSADPWDLGLGALLSLVVLIAFRDFVHVGESGSLRPVWRRVARFPALILATFISIVQGTIQVARVVLTWSPPRGAGLVEIPKGARTDIGVAISGLLLTLSPGSVLTDIDTEAQTWTIHALDAADEEAVRATVEEFYDRYQRPVWP